MVIEEDSANTNEINDDKDNNIYTTIQIHDHDNDNSNENKSNGNVNDMKNDDHEIMSNDVAKPLVRIQIYIYTLVINIDVVCGLLVFCCVDFKL